mgnify:CR=1 FL=1
MQGERGRERSVTYREVNEMNDRPGRARTASKEGEDDKPAKEYDRDVGGPHARVLEPRCVLVQIRWWVGLDILQAPQRIGGDGRICHG